MREKMSKRDKITLAVFVFVTLTAGGWGALVDQVLTDQPQGDSLGMGIWLALPLITGIVLRLINKNLKQLGVRVNLKGNGKWYAVAFLTFPVTTIICAIAATIAGGLTVGAFETGALLIMMLTTFLADCVKNVFEEFAWRGCLVPFLEKTGMNDWMLYLTSGCIWGMWHIAYYLFFLPDSYFVEISRSQMVILGIVLMIFWSPLFVELRRLTDSVWPCVILHSMEDAVPTLLFVTAGVFSISKGCSVALDPISGIVPTVLILLTGLGLRKLRMAKENSQKMDE